MRSRVIIVLALVSMFIQSCTVAEYEVSDSGLNYKYVKNGEGPAPEDGSVILMNISYLDVNGDILFSSADGQEGALALSYADSMFTRTGGIEEGFKMIQKGDSLVLQFPIEDLYENTFNMPLPDTLSRGSNVTVCMGAAEVFTMEEYQAYRQEQYFKLQEEAKLLEGVQFETDTKILDDYLGKENIETVVHESGLRFKILEKGNGPIPQNGQQVSVNYTGRLLTGEVFDTSNADLAKEQGIYDARREPYQPYSFELGIGGVIRGWDIGIGLMNTGSKAVLYVPSRLAYGPRQMGPSIPANAILVFDVELVATGD